jgi:two-component system cell cycle sensor histidine kinase/response regulator CckA
MSSTAAILIVEDDPAVRRLVDRTLTAQGWPTIPVSSAAEAITRVIQYDGPIPLAIVDIVMPQIGGFDLANQLQTTRPSTRVLYISGYSASVAVESLSAVAPETILRKPFTATELLTRIRELLAR